MTDKYRDHLFAPITAKWRTSGSDDDDCNCMMKPIPGRLKPMHMKHFIIEIMTVTWRLLQHPKKPSSWSQLISRHSSNEISWFHKQCNTIIPIQHNTVHNHWNLTSLVLFLYWNDLIKHEYVEETSFYLRHVRNNERTADSGLPIVNAHQQKMK